MNYIKGKKSKEYKLKDATDEEAGSNSKSGGKPTNYTAKIHIAVWPKFDDETFFEILDSVPNVANSTFGLCQDTLLHRLVFKLGQISNTFCLWLS